MNVLILTKVLINIDISKRSKQSQRANSLSLTLTRSQTALLYTNSQPRFPIFSPQPPPSISAAALHFPPPHSTLTAPNQPHSPPWSTTSLSRRRASLPRYLLTAASRPLFNRIEPRSLASKLLVVCQDQTLII
ncbi:hypothetical protein Droror1_Dr00005167 [Drosera rotundifolia]